MVIIEAPKESSYDEAITVKVSQLQPHQRVTITAETSRNEAHLLSFANYEADGSGVVDLTQQSATTGGTFEGLEPMGLFWAMNFTTAQNNPLKMLSGFDLNTLTHSLKVFDGHFQSFEEAKLKTAESKPLAECSIERLWLPKGVTRLAVRHGAMRGALFLPEGDGPFPAIIDIVGGARGLIAYRGGLFAGHGFACLCIAYAGYEDLPPKPLETSDTDYFNDGFLFLQQHASIRKGAIGVYGECMGGTFGLALARCQPGIKAAVAVCPWAFAGDCNYRLRPIGTDEVIEVPGVKLQPELLKPKDGFINLWEAISGSMNGNWNQHSLEFGLIKAPVLIFFGSDDKTFDCDFFLKATRDQFEKTATTDFEIIKYDGAGHNIRPPYFPLGAHYYHSGFKAEILFGGQTVPHARAQEDCWYRTLKFFGEKLTTAN